MTLLLGRGDISEDTKIIIKQPQIGDGSHQFENYFLKINDGHHHFQKIRFKNAESLRLFAKLHEKDETTA